MRSKRVPLYARFAVWSALNLLLIAALAYAYAPRNQTGANLLLTESVRERLVAIALSVADDLYNVDAEQWPTVIAEHQDIAHVRFEVRAGPRPPSDAPPPDFRPPPHSMGAPGAPGGLGGPGGMGGRGPRDLAINIHGANDGYDVTIPVIAAGHGGPPRGYLVNAHADDGFALLRLLGLGREIAFVTAALVLSALLWWPFIWQNHQAYWRAGQRNRADVAPGASTPGLPMSIATNWASWRTPSIPWRSGWS